MSYDVSVGDFCGNYTRNQSAMFHDHIGSGGNTGLQAIHGLTGRESVPVLSNAFDRLMNVRRECGNLDHYNSENGWGSALGGVLFMAQIMAACASNPDEIVHVSA